jgi:uncharacterized protein YcbK (DUF882 family)
MTDRAARIARYAEWLTIGGAAHDAFTGHEVATLADRLTKGVRNDIPPVELWHRIVPTLVIAQRLRQRFGPTRINSAYRSPAYNAAIGGEKASWHMQNVALDLAPSSGTPREWAAWAREDREQHGWRGGIGTYTRQRFIHLDTRGTNAEWGT